MTTPSPISSVSETPHDNERLGVALDVTHEPDAVYLSIRLRFPRGAVLRTITDMLNGGSGFERTSGKGYEEAYAKEEGQ